MDIEQQRRAAISEAKYELVKVMGECIQKHGLTYHEVLSILLDEAQAMNRDGMRREWETR